MDKETKALIDFYKNQIKDKQDKLDKIKKECNETLNDSKNDFTYSGMVLSENILKIIKGEDK